jgi:hypothetical protein
MAIQLNYQPQGDSAPTIAEGRLVLKPTAVAKRAKQLPRVVLRVPRVVGCGLAVASEDVREDEPDHRRQQGQHAELKDQRSRLDRTSAALRESSKRAVSAWQSLEWSRIVDWMGRPIVTYVSAAVVLLTIVVAIVAKPRASAEVDQSPLQSSLNDVTSTLPDEQLRHTVKPPVQPNSQSESTVPLSDAVVKLPPVNAGASEKRSHILPWRQDAASALASTTPEATNAHDRAVAFPPSASANPEANIEKGTVERPNVARLEGRILTPQLKR